MNLARTVNPQASAPEAQEPSLPTILTIPLRAFSDCCVDISNQAVSCSPATASIIVVQLTVA